MITPPKLPTASDSEIEYVNKVFPEISLISDKDLQRIVAEIWVEMWKESGWRAIEDCPKNPLSYEIKLVPHIRCITNLCIEFAKTVQKFHTIPGGVKMDELIAGALLHDTDKLMIYSSSTNRVEKTRFSKMLPHGTYTGYKMLARGLSFEIVNLVVAHSEKAVRMEPATVEGLIHKHLDHGESMVMNLIIGQSQEK